MSLPVSLSVNIYVYLLSTRMPNRDARRALVLKMASVGMSTIGHYLRRFASYLADGAEQVRWREHRPFPDQTYDDALRVTPAVKGGCNIFRRSREIRAV